MSSVLAVRSCVPPVPAATIARPRLEATFGAVDQSVLTAFQRRPAILRGAPLGYRVERYSPTSASVAIWTVTLAASPGFEATAQWRTLVVDLSWTAHGWRVERGDGSSGPDPATPLRGLAIASDRFRSFRHVP